MNFERIYEYRFSGVDQVAKRESWREISRWLYEYLGEPKSALDPAAGDLEFLEYFPCEEKMAVDLRRSPYLDKVSGIEFKQGNFLTTEVEENRFDATFLSNFLEHLNSPEEIQVLLKKLFSALKPGGKIAVMGPNFKYCSKVYFDCADHKLILTDTAVAEHLYAAGFNVVSQIDRFLPFSFRGKLPPKPFLVRAYLKCPAAWPLLGKQFLVVGEKPSNLAV
ncbi:MAG: methyltransferase type 11 [Bdellovibrionales bacterium CG10_big_fil_rev_8_21_14_0_10_45_34]|nr:MAG: methyltransferase type 11 [Bdellovibrionales bacterium CG10_big_fil_rev_8_21_14_0_10_45_34]